MKGSGRQPPTIEVHGDAQFQIINIQIDQDALRLSDQDLPEIRDNRIVAERSWIRTLVLAIVATVVGGLIVRYLVHLFGW